MKHHHRENQRIEQKLGRKRERKKSRRKAPARREIQGYSCQAEKKARPHPGRRVMGRTGVGGSTSNNWEEASEMQAPCWCSPSEQHRYSTGSDGVYGLVRGTQVRGTQVRGAGPPTSGFHPGAPHHGRWKAGSSTIE